MKCPEILEFPEVSDLGEMVLGPQRSWTGAGGERAGSVSWLGLGVRLLGFCVEARNRLWVGITGGSS